MCPNVIPLDLMLDNRDFHVVLYRSSLAWCPPHARQRDNRRGSYSLKETMLAKRLCAACGLAETSPDVDAVINWRTRATGFVARSAGGSAKRGRAAKPLLTGNFVAVLHEHLFIKHCKPEETGLGFTVGKLNEMLDKLAAAAVAGNQPGEKAVASKQVEVLR